MTEESNQSIGNEVDLEFQIRSISLSNFDDESVFKKIYDLDHKSLVTWLQSQNLIKSSHFCQKCLKFSKFGYKKKYNEIKYVFRCKNNICCTAVTKFSLFEDAKTKAKNILLFFREYLLGTLMKYCALKADIRSSKCIVSLGKRVREVFTHKVWNILLTEKFENTVEIYFDTFGADRLEKYGKKIRRLWVFGLLEKSSNRLIAFPVASQESSVLCPIIKRYVAKGSTLISTSWAEHLDIDDLGYTHVVKKEITDNKDSNAWFVTRHRFKASGSKSGISSATFESHLCEQIYRRWYAKDNIFQVFFSDVVNCYPLDREPKVLDLPDSVFSYIVASNFKRLEKAEAHLYTEFCDLPLDAEPCDDLNLDLDKIASGSYNKSILKIFSPLEKAVKHRPKRPISDEHASFKREDHSYATFDGKKLKLDEDSESESD